MFVTLIHNAHAGEGTAEEILTDALRTHGHAVTVIGADRESIASAFSMSPDVVIVAGGDGTVRQVAQELVSRPLPLAIFVAGTANNIAGSVGGFGDPMELASALSTPSAVDAGLAVLGSRRIVFLESAGCGSMTRLMRDLEDRSRRARTRDRDRGFRAKLQRMRELLKHQRAFEAAVDGESDAYLLIEVMNTHSIGPNLQLSDALPDDGLLDLVAVRESEREQFDELLRRAIDGETFRSLSTRRVRTVDLRCPAAELHLDDEFDFGEEMTTIGAVALPAALRVIRHS